MDLGMLWFDDSRRSLAEKVQRAADFYLSKYGQQATECHVHPRTLGPAAPAYVGIVRLVPSSTVVRDHYWLGVGDDGGH